MKKSKPLTKLITKFDTILTADCVEFCSPFLLCASYQLNPKTKTREGIIHFFVVKENKKTDYELFHLKELEKKLSSGIFDLKFSYCKEKYVFGIALSSGMVDFYQIKHKEGKEKEKNRYSILKLSSFYFFPSLKNMCLSMDWKKTLKDPLVTTSHSNGKISISQFSDKNGSLKNLNDIKAHEYEVWNVEFDYRNKNIVFSGGDDSLFKCWDIKSCKNIFVSKEHQSGVCCIKSHPNKENIVGTGSYDEKVRIFDIRKIEKPLLVKTIDCKDGVWKIRWNKERENILLTACMKSGFKIVNTKLFPTKKENEFGEEILCTFHETKDLSYGIDWVYTKNKKNELYVGSCSFYDHQMQFWKLYNSKKF